MTLRPLRLPLLPLLGLLLACTEPGPDLESLIAGTVRVIVADAAGDRRAVASGFVISMAGHVVTVLRPLASAGQVFVVPAGATDDGMLPATVIWSSESEDLAVLAVDNLRQPPMVIAEEAPEGGAEVFLMAYPDAPCCGADKITPELKAGNMGRVVKLPVPWRPGDTGRLVKLPPQGGGASISVLMHSVTIAEGGEGAPLLDSCGAVVGVASLGLDPLGTPSKGIFFATPVATLAAGLEDNGIAFTRVGKPCRER